MVHSRAGSRQRPGSRRNWVWLGFAASLFCAIRAAAAPCPADQVETGDAFSLLRATDGSAWTWGQVIGLSADTSQLWTEPGPVPGLTGIVDIAAGEAHSVVVRDDGTVWAWGFNANWVLGAELPGGVLYSTAPVQVPRRDAAAPPTDPGLPPSEPVIEAACGANHCLARTVSGSVYAWGRGVAGQLGRAGDRPTEAPPRIVPLARPAIRVGAGDDGSLAILDDGTLWTWGSNDLGTLGLGGFDADGDTVLDDADGDTIPDHVDWADAPQQVTSLAGVADADLGDNFGLACLQDGSAWSWGNNWRGQLGDPAIPADGRAVRLIPGPIVLPDAAMRVEKVRAGKMTGFAILADGRMLGWGDDEDGQVGDDPPARTQRSPVPVQEIGLVRDVATAASHAVAVDADGTPWSWGSNVAGDLGLGWSGIDPVPAIVSGLHRVVEVHAGGRHGLARTEDGSVWTWGSNAIGQLGDGRGRPSARPVAVPLPGPATSASTLGEHSLAVVAGEVWSWGNGDLGQLGDSTSSQSDLPVRVLGLSGARQVAAGGGHSLALLDDGTLRSWGANSSGELGIGRSGGSINSAQVVVSADTYRFVAAGGGSSFAITTGGNVHGWGSNFHGALGVGDEASRDLPTPVVDATLTPLAGVISVSASSGHGLALKDDGTVWAWGEGADGTLGDGLNQVSLHAVQVMIDATTPLDRVVAIGTHSFQSVAVRDDGTVWAWGQDRTHLFVEPLPAGALHVDHATRIDALDDIASVVLGVYHRYALTSTGDVLSWGQEYAGELGRVDHPQAVLPVQVTCACTDDADGDAIPDAWESGALHPLLDLRAWGASPDKADLFVEIDAMEGRAPSPRALRMIEDAFASAPHANPDGTTGIRIHLVVDETDLAREPWLDDPWAAFDALKAARFGNEAQRQSPEWSLIRNALQRTFRYAVFADTHRETTGSACVPAETCLRSSGAAELPGNDLFVTLGQWPVPGGSPEQQAGTLMHELGHLLGLRHGGDDDTPNAPNYHSIMNPTWQVPTLGYEGSWILDFSSEAWPALDEAALDERTGLGGHALHRVPVGLADGSVQIVYERGPIDWNGDGDTSDTAVAADVDRVNPAAPATPGRVIAGFDDWEAIDFRPCGSMNFTLDTRGGTTLDHELTLSRAPTGTTAGSAGWIDCNNDGRSDTQDIADRRVLDCTGVADPADCEPLIRLGLAADCDGNCIIDTCDIADGRLTDANLDGIADDCDATGVPPPATPGLRVSRVGAGVRLAWTGPAPRTDVVQGSLAVLRAELAAGSDAARAYELAVDACLLRDGTVRELTTPGTPASGDTTFFVARGVNCLEAGTWDSGTASQRLSRDRGIDAKLPFLICP